MRQLFLVCFALAVSLPTRTAFAAAPPVDILTQLQAVPGLTVTEQPSPRPDYRYFVMTFDQPADHDHPDGQRFAQALTLLHRDTAAPMVLFTTGYWGIPVFYPVELTRLIGANQLGIEHRFFGSSRPDPADWSLLNIRQAADDFHRIVEALKPIYGGRWLSTGVSKGGGSVLYHRRFYPDDVYATVAYVAPLSLRDDPRYIRFLDNVGTSACRDRLHALQQAVLDRKAEILPLLLAEANQNGWTYNHLGIDKAYEHLVEEFYFSFWQTSSITVCDAVPAPDATAYDIYTWLHPLVGWDYFSDQALDVSEPFYYQSATQLGYAAPYDYFLKGLSYPGTDIAEQYVSRPLPPYDYAALLDVQLWLALQGQRIMLIYGNSDPFSAVGHYELGLACDSYEYWAQTNHAAHVVSLDPATQAAALQTLSRWAAAPIVPQAVTTMQREATQGSINLVDRPMPPFGPRTTIPR
jgi:hypothetical protein